MTSKGERQRLSDGEEERMLRESIFLLLFFVFLVIWLVSWLAFHIAGGLIHLLVVIAVISLMVHFVKGRAA